MCCFPMRSRYTIFVILSVLLLSVSRVPFAAPQGVSLHAGPAEEPQKWPDYGGTPDISVPDELKLTVLELESLLQRLGSLEQNVRVRAAEEMQRDAKGSESVFRTLLWRNHGATNAEMKDAMREAAQIAPQKKNGTTELLDGLLMMDPTSTEHGKGTLGALRIVAMLRALQQLDTLSAYKVMIDFSPRHAGVFRHEIGRMLVAQGLKALPALVYGRGSSNREIHMFCVKWIRDMGDPLLSEQIKIKNPRRLAQLLEAYASVNELDAIDVTLSLANHPSVFVRAAARSSLAKYGRNTIWIARKQYEITFSKEAPDEWDENKVLSELYSHFDSRRIAEINKIFERGKVAYNSGRLDEMAALYNEVLRKDPFFHKRSEMAEGFIALAAAKEKAGQKEVGYAFLKTALRVSEVGSETHRRIRAELLWRKAENLRKKGLADASLYKRVLDLDPTHQESKRLYDELSNSSLGQDRLFGKAITISIVIFLSMSLIYMRLR